MVDSATARISGESEAGFTVLGCGSTRDCVEMGRLSASVDEPKSSCEKVMGVCVCRNCSVCSGDAGDGADEPRKTAIDEFPPTRSSSAWYAAHRASASAKRIKRSWFCRSTACFSASSASTSCRLRSRDDCAARRLRRTRSTRRCSFSSSVFARFLESGLAD